MVGSKIIRGRIRQIHQTPGADIIIIIVRIRILNKGEETNVVDSGEAI